MLQILDSASRFGRKCIFSSFRDSMTKAFGNMIRYSYSTQPELFRNTYMTAIPIIIAETLTASKNIFTASNFMSDHRVFKKQGTDKNL